MSKNPYSFSPPPGAGAAGSVFKQGVQEIPTLQNCDLDDPREMFAWMFVQTPGLAGSGAELMLPREWCNEMSQRLYDCGARLDLSAMTIRYVPPMPGASYFMGPSGRWEDIPEGQNPFREASVDSVSETSVHDTEGSHSDSDDDTDDSDDEDVDHD